MGDVMRIIAISYARQKNYYKNKPFPCGPGSFESIKGVPIRIYFEKGIRNKLRGGVSKSNHTISKAIWNKFIPNCTKKIM